MARVWTLPEDGQPATWIEPEAGALPPGGTTGEVLTKESDADGDAGWEPRGGSVPALYARISIPGGHDSGADVSVPFSSGTPNSGISDGMALTGPSTFVPEHITHCFLRAPEPAGAALFLSYAEFMVSNADGTQKLRIEYDGDPIDLTAQFAGGDYTLPFDDCSITEQIGDDLALVSIDTSGIPSSGTAAIQSTAGGQFFQELLVQLNYTPPT